MRPAWPGCGAWGQAPGALSSIILFLIPCKTKLRERQLLKLPTQTLPSEVLTATLLSLLSSVLVFY